MIPAAEGFAAMVVGLAEALNAAEKTAEVDSACMSSIRSAKAIAMALSHMADDLLGIEDGEFGGEPDAVASTDPETCGHPAPYFELPNGQVMCESCGMSHFGDGNWRIV